jgi:crotonobetainyl-CoA:carnitine CoA-transferase CaiB-like acyl-CoA transferase
MSKPLEGFRILDFSQFMSGPMCTLLLNDFGAEVIKIENPPIGDNTRYGNIIDNGTSSHFATRNRGKKSIVLNMKDEAHKNLFLELVKTADAVLENYKPGTMAKFGIDYEVLKEINPKIVFTSISGYGQDGPYSDHAAFDQTVQAESGIMSITGQEGGEPVKCGGSIADYSGGLMACIGTLMGIIEAQRTGHGRRVDVSMMDSLIFCMENQFSSYLRTGIVPKPSGNSYASSAPIGAYECKDGKSLMITVGTDAQWKTFCEALSQPQWFENANWATMTQRAKDYKAIDAEVLRVFSDYTSDEVAEILQKNNCVYGKINDFEAVANHPQVAHRKTIVNAVFQNGTTFKVPGNPIHMSDVERQTEYSAATLGQHTFEVLKEVADEKTLHDLFDPVFEKVTAATNAIYSKSK